MHDTSNSHPNMHWPAGLSPNEAHAFFQRQAMVTTPPDRAFALFTDVSSWLDWSPGVTAVSSEALEQFFYVQWHGHRFEVFVGESEPPHRVGLLGIGAGVQLYQAWLITAVEGGTHVVTENVVRGEAPKALDTLSATWVRLLDDLWMAQVNRMADGLPWHLVEGDEPP
ncbi:SRPBCC family protein [Streptomyces tendae]